MIRLFSSAFPVLPGTRRLEYAECLRRNLACRAIDGVFLLDEGSADLPASDSRLHVRSTASRPTYADYFDWINEIAAADDISIIANADIFFDEQLALFNRWTLPSNSVIALSRWECSQDGYELHDHNDSQDAWFFRGSIRPLNGDFHVGVPRCDNRLVSELRRAGYIVLNPAFGLRSYHLHAGDRDEYGHGQLPGYVSPPYEYVWPENLWSLAATVAYNFRYSREKIGWRIDRRKWSSRLKLHWFAKGLGILRNFAS